MTTEQDDNLRHNLLHPDVIHGMWKNEPVKKVILLSKELDELTQKYISQKNSDKPKISQHDYIKRLQEIKYTLSQQEIFVEQTINHLSSKDLKVKTRVYLERLREQLIKIKDIIYSHENRAILNSIVLEKKPSSYVEKANLLEMQADEAFWLLNNEAIYQIKSKVADLIFDIQLLYHWIQNPTHILTENIISNPEENIEWWMRQLLIPTDKIQCKNCKSNTFSLFNFCVHCLTTI
ncbi:MAG: hypothetical protein ABGX20_11110 [Bacillus sp. (in: firmicutes)]